MEMSGIAVQIIVISIASISTFVGGFHVGWISPSLAKLQAEDSDLPVTSDQGAWIASIFNFATVFGSLITAVVADRWGRKPALASTGIPYAVAFILIIAAQNYWWLIIARVIAALGYGTTSTAIVMYFGEIVSDKFRGAFGVFISLTVNVGILLAYCVGPWTSRAAFAGVGLAISIVFLLGSFWMPETPYFLVMKNRNKDAEKLLVRLRGTSDVREELENIAENIAMKKDGNFKDLMMIQGNRKSLIILFILILGQQWSGINAILAYASLILDVSGFALSSSISVIIVGAVQVFSVGLSVFTADWFGRRPLLVVSLCGSIVFLAAEAMYFQLETMGNNVTSISWLPVTALIGYIVFYSIGISCYPLVMASELFPYNVKAYALISMMFVSAVSGAAVTKLYQVVADAYGIHVCFWGFSGCCVLALIIIYFIVPETKQKSLNDIQKSLRSSIGSKPAIK